MRHVGWGVNLDFDNDPFGRPSPAELGLLGWARLVCRSQAFADYVQSLAGSGVRSIIVLARESMPHGAVEDLFDDHGNVVGLKVDFDRCARGHGSRSQCGRQRGKSATSGITREAVQARPGCGHSSTGTSRYGAPRRFEACSRTPPC